MNTKRIIWSIVGVAAVIAGIAFLVWMYWSSSSQTRKAPKGQWFACQTDQDCSCVGEKDFPGCVNSACINGKCGWRSDASGKTSTTTVQNTAANSSTSLTAGWQTYRNEQYGYSFRYPLDDFLNGELGAESDEDMQNTCPFHSGFCIFNYDYRLYSRIYPTNPDPWVVTNYKGSLQDLAMNVWNLNKKVVKYPNEGEKRKRVSDLATTTFAGEPAYEFSVTESFDVDSSGGYVVDGEHQVIFVSHDDNKFRITYRKHDPIGQAIADSFQFIEPISDTSTWQQYRNEQYGFEIKYPSDWFIIAEDSGLVRISNYKKEDFYEPMPPSPDGLFVEFQRVVTCSASSDEYVDLYSGGAYTGDPDMLERALCFNKIHARARLYKISAAKEKDIKLLDQILSTFKFNSQGTTAASCEGLGEQTCLANTRCAAYYLHLEAPPLPQPGGNVGSFANSVIYQKCVNKESYPALKCNKIVNSFGKDLCRDQTVY